MSSGFRENARPSISSGTSPAVGGGSCPLAPTDQRGFPRVGACDIGAYEFGSTLADSAPPVCKLVGVLAANPKQMDVDASDALRGLQTLTQNTAVNANVVIPYFTPGSNLVTTVAAVKINQAMGASWSFNAIDQAGNPKLCT